MSQLSAAAASPFGIAAFIFLALGVAGLFGLVGKGARASLAVAGIGSFAILFVVAVLFPIPGPGGTAETAGDPPATPEVRQTPQVQVQVERPDQPAAPRDIRRARELLAEAQEHNNLGRTAQAREAFADAEDRFREADDLGGAGAVAMGLGNLEASLGQSDEARDAYAKARDLFRRSGSELSEALVLAALGDLEKTTLQFSAARAAYAEARQVFADIGGGDGGGHILLGLEALAAMPNGEEAARRALGEAHLLYQQIEDPKGLGLVARVTADLERTLGHVGQAYTQYRDAIVLMEMADDREQLAETWLRLGNMELSQGFHNTADDALRRSLALYQSMGAYEGVAKGQMGLGHLRRLLGKYEEALLRYTAALDAYTGVGDSSGQATAVFGMAETGRLAGRWSAARDRYTLAIALGDRGGEHGLAALGWLGLSRMEIGAQVAAPISQAVAVAQDSGDERARGLVFLAWGSYQAGSGDAAVAREFLVASAAAFQAGGLPLGQTAALAELAVLERDQGNPAAADAAIADARTHMAGLDDLLAAANQLLGLGDFGELRVHLNEQGEEIDYELDDAPGAEVVAEAAQEEPVRDAHAEALLGYPLANAEATAFLTKVFELMSAP